MKIKSGKYTIELTIDEVNYIINSYHTSNFNMLIIELKEIFKALMEVSN